MRPTEFPADQITSLLRQQTTATMPELKAALGTNSKQTVFYKLKMIPYRSSYSHRGRYYTLDESAHFDEHGLWSHQGVWFSCRCTLIETAAETVKASNAGYFVYELDDVLHVGTNDVLRKLVLEGRLTRQKVSGQFLYCSPSKERNTQQLMSRRAMLADPDIVKALPSTQMIPDELRAALVLFVSLLDEQQRRLYAGLESLKSGRGGDRRMAELIGLDMGTVARGRRELLAQDVAIDRVRRAGGGRPSVEKKHRKSSKKSRR